jgi:thiosulfate/3-mercaptopyruvate sulfurtransferase
VSATPPPLIEAAGLAARLVDAADPPVVLDARFVLADPGAGDREFAEARLPGALRADLDRDLSDHARPATEGRHPLPAPTAWRARVGAWGITPGVEVVAYDAAGGALAAARAWMLMRLLGHARVRVLAGGIAAWEAAGLALERDAPRTPVAVVPYPASPGASPDAWSGAAAARLPDAAALRARLAREPTGWLFDVRAPERYRGDVEPLDPVAGHVPGAANLPFAGLFEADARLPAPDALRARLEAVLAGRASADATLMCGSGVTAAFVQLAFVHAGLDAPALYAPSWSGWIREPGAGVARGG